MRHAILPNLFNVEHREGLFRTSFTAMASECEFLIGTSDENFAHKLSEKGVGEVRRIEQKFSRYRQDNLCYAINNAEGKSVELDEECYRLLDFAQTCYGLSDGLFDLTSGVLRRVWNFDCSDRIPKQEDIDRVLPLVGWEHVSFDHCSLKMKPDMEIDFGGIGKEYAVSRVADICQQSAPDVSVLINLGGDIQVTKARDDGKPWSVGVESTSTLKTSTNIISIVQGALATSGDSKRYLIKNGERYSHILNPKTGWPIQNAPASITVLSPLCIQAGCLATLALLNGENAENFLKEQEVKYWCERS